MDLLHRFGKKKLLTQNIRKSPRLNIGSFFLKKRTDISLPLKTFYLTISIDKLLIIVI